MHEPEPPPIELDEPVAPPDRPGPKRLAAGVVAVLAVGAAAFGISTLAASDGADSPEAAVDAFFDAVDDEDVIGVLEAVDPVERTPLRRAIEGVVVETDRAEITSDVDLGDIAGADLEVADLDHETERLTDDLAAVDLTAGTVDAGVSIVDLPFGRTVTDVLGADPDDPEAAELDLSGVRVMTVRRDGAWYVSPSYTGAEAIRRAADPELALPAFGTAPAPVGADSPEQAVRDLAAALDAFDVAAMIATTSPTRAPVLHDYGPMLVDVAEDTDPDVVALSDLTLASEPSTEGSTVVRVTGYELSMESSSETVTHRLDDGCLVTTYSYVEDPEYPSPEDLGFPVTTSSCDTDQVGVGPFWFAPFGMSGDSLSFVTVEEGGRWFIDPLDSLAEGLVGSLRALSTEQLQNLAYLWSGAYWIAEPDELWAACGIERPAPDVGEEAGWQAVDDCYAQLPDDYEGPWGMFGDLGPVGSGSFECGSSADDAVLDECWVDDLGEEGPIPPGAMCWSTGDVDEIEACLEAGVADGTIDETELAYFRCDMELDGLDAMDEIDDEGMAAYEACLAEVEGG